MLRDDDKRVEQEFCSADDMRSAFKKGIERGKKHHRSRYRRGVMRVGIACILSMMVFVGGIKMYPAAAMELIDVPIIGDIIKLFTYEKNMERAVAHGYLTKLEDIDEEDFKIEYAMRDKHNLVLVVDFPEVELEEKASICIKNFTVRDSEDDVVFSRESVLLSRGELIKIENYHEYSRESEYVYTDDFNNITGKNTISGELIVQIYNEETEKFENIKKIVDINEYEIDFDMIQKSTGYEKYINDRIPFDEEDITLTKVEVQPFQMEFNFVYRTVNGTDKIPKGVDVILEDDKGNVWSKKNGLGIQNSRTVSTSGGIDSETPSDLECRMSALLDSPIFKDCNAVYLKELKVKYIEYPETMTINLKTGSIDEKMMDNFIMEKFDENEDYYFIELSRKGEVNFGIGNLHRPVTEYDKNKENSWTTTSGFKENEITFEYFNDGWHEKERYMDINDYESIRIKLSKEPLKDSKHSTVTLSVRPPVESYTVEKDTKVWDRDSDPIVQSTIPNIAKRFKNNNNMVNAVKKSYLTKLEDGEEGEFNIEYAMRDKRSLVFIADIPKYKELNRYEDLWIKNFRLDGIYQSSWVKVEKGGVIKIGDFNYGLGKGGSATSEVDFNSLKGEYHIYGQLCKRKLNEDTEVYEIEENLLKIDKVGVNLDKVKKSEIYERKFHEKIPLQGEDIFLTRVEADVFQMILDFKFESDEITDKTFGWIDIVVEDDNGFRWTEKTGGGTSQSSSDGAISKYVDSPIFKDSNEVYLKRVKIEYSEYPAEMTININDGSIDENMMEHFSLKKITEDEDYYVIEIAPKGDIHFGIGQMRKSVIKYGDTREYSWVDNEWFNKDEISIEYLKDGWHERKGNRYIRKYDNIRVKVLKEAFKDSKDPAIFFFMDPPKKSYAANTNLKIWERETEKDN